MAEVLGAVAAAAQLTATCLALLDLTKRIKARTSTLEKYQTQLSQLQQLSESITSNPLLQTPEIELHARNIISLLSHQTLEPSLHKSRVSQIVLFFSQDRDVSRLFIDLERQKATLSLVINEVQSRALYDIQRNIHTMSDRRKSATGKAKAPCPPPENMLHDDLHRVRAFLNATLADPNFDMRFGNPENAMARRDAGASEHFAPPSQAPNTTARGSYYDNIEKTKALTRLAMDVWGKPEPPPGVRLGCVASGNQDQTNGNLIEGIRPSEAYTKAEQDDNRLYMACHASHGATQVNGDEFIPSGEGEPWVISRSRSSYIGCFAINEDAGAEGPRSRQVNGNYYRFDGRQSRTSGSGKK